MFRTVIDLFRQKRSKLDGLLRDFDKLSVVLELETVGDCPGTWCFLRPQLDLACIGIDTNWNGDNSCMLSVMGEFSTWRPL